MIDTARAIRYAPANDLVAFPPAIQAVLGWPRIHGGNMNRTFRHLDQDWEVQPTGIGNGGAYGYKPSITRWGMSFRCLSDASKGPFYGHLNTPDPTQATEEELRRILSSAMILKALGDPQWDWRTVEGMSEDTGLPERQIIDFIESSPDKVIRSQTPDERGRALYMTRQRYSKKRGFLDPFRTT